MGDDLARSTKTKRIYGLIVVAVTLLLSAIIFVIYLGSQIRMSPAPDANIYTVKVLMLRYAKDHGGVYPTGKSSTEVFQKLLDEKYTTDPTLFYNEFRLLSICQEKPGVHIPGKVKPTSNKLKPENVCLDVTIPIDAASSDYVPIVFSTGWRIDYVAHGTATALFKSSADRPFCIEKMYKGSDNGGVQGADPNGIVRDFISKGFHDTDRIYQQLTPEGPLPP